MMHLWQAVLYIVAVALLVLAGIGVTSRFSLALLGAACALLAFALPVIANNT
jgi:hypothetical protein